MKFYNQRIELPKSLEEQILHVFLQFFITFLFFLHFFFCFLHFFDDQMSLQQLFVLQCRVCDPTPKQYSPPGLGTGALHFLFLVCFPLPHGLLHFPYELHRPHPPFTN